MRDENLDRTWGRFFPFGDHRTPPRNTWAEPEFWRTYREPAHEFLGAVDVLQQATGLCNNFRYGEEETGKAAQAANWLARLASSAAPRLEPREGGRFQIQWVSTTLLTTLSLMVMDDLRGGRLYKCEHCGRAMISESRQPRYCSSACKSTFIKRRWRKRKNAKELRDAGLKPYQIARKLGIRTVEVKDLLNSAHDPATRTSRESLGPKGRRN